jgi:hypothetical protein
MSWAGEALKSLKKVILIEEKVSTLADDVKLLALKYQELSERVARMEGKFEAYERVAAAAAQSKKLAAPRKENAG